MKRIQTAAAAVLFAFTALALGPRAAAQPQRLPTAAAYVPKPIPNNPAGKTWVQFGKNRKAWEQQAIKNSIAALQNPPPFAAPLLEAFLEADRVDGFKLSDALTNAAAAARAGNVRTPAICYMTGRVAEALGDKRNAALDFEQAQAGSGRSEAWRNLVCGANLRAFGYLLNHLNDESGAGRAADIAIRLIDGAVANAAMPADEQRYWYWTLHDNAVGIQGQYLRDRFTKALAPGLEANSWLSRMLTANIYMSVGTTARGGDTADQVTAAGWQSLAQNLSKAEALLRAAHAQAPDRPEAAAGMLSIMMYADSSALDMREWFDRAVAAELDFDPAYGALAIALLPRWGKVPSHAALSGLANEALATGRFDSAAPLNYLTLLALTTWDFPKPAWRIVFRQPGVREKMIALADGYAATAPQVLSANQAAGLRAMAEAWSGNYIEAAAALAKLPAGAEIEPTFAIPEGMPMTFPMRSRATLEAEARAFTGAQAAVLKRAEELELSGSTTQAIALYKTAMTALAADPAARDYLRDRVALALLDPSAQNYRGGEEGNPARIFGTAVATGSTESWSYLLDNGLDPKAKDRDGSPLLKIAARGADREALRRLLAAGADPNATDEDGFTSLYTAATEGNEDYVRLMLAEKPNLEFKSSRLNYTPLIQSVRKGHAGVAKALIEAGADPNAVQIEGRTSLHMAAYNDDPAMIAMLIKAGANPNGADPNQDTPLDYARRFKKDRAVAALVAAGGKANAKAVVAAKGAQTGSVEWDEFFDAAGAGDVAKLKSMIEQGANINAKTGGGATPLHAAVFHGDPAAVTLLLQNGAKAMPLTEGGWAETTQRLGRLHRGTQQLSLLKSHPKIKPDGMPMIADMNKTNAILAALDADPEWKAWAADLDGGLRNLAGELIDSPPGGSAVIAPIVLGGGRAGMRRGRGGEQLPPLHQAIADGNIQALREGINRGADVNEEARGSVTPLNLAVLKGDLDMIGLLVDSGADVGRLFTVTMIPHAGMLGASVRAIRREPLFLPAEGVARSLMPLTVNAAQKEEIMAILARNPAWAALRAEREAKAAPIP